MAQKAKHFRTFYETGRFIAAFTTACYLYFPKSQESPGQILSHFIPNTPFLNSASDHKTWNFVSATKTGKVKCAKEEKKQLLSWCAQKYPSNQATAKWTISNTYSVNFHRRGHKSSLSLSPLLGYPKDVYKLKSSSFRDFFKFPFAFSLADSIHLPRPLFSPHDLSARPSNKSPSHRISGGGGETTMNIREIGVTENSLLYWSQTT